MKSELKTSSLGAPLTKTNRGSNVGLLEVNRGCVILARLLCGTAVANFGFKARLYVQLLFFNSGKVISFFWSKREYYSKTGYEGIPENPGTQGLSISSMVNVNY